MKIEEIKDKHLLDLQEECQKNSVNFHSISKLLDAEKVKKLLKRNHYIQQTIDSEIENCLNYENK